MAIDQGQGTHERISNRIYSLLDLALKGLYDQLTNERMARRKLATFPALLDYSRVRSISVVADPFFRRVLRASAGVTLYKLRERSLMPVPGNLARIMFGVVDETGTLQYGQVFFQYTTELGDQKPGWEQRFTLHQGRVLVSDC